MSVVDKWLLNNPNLNSIIFYLFFLSRRMQQSVRGHSAAMLAGNDSDMQGIHPVMYLL
jgi:hypothetical protein